MNKCFLGNAFSLQMLRGDALVEVKEVKNPCLKDGVFSGVVDGESFATEIESVVGHADTASVLGVPCNRVSVTLNKGDSMIVAQLMGGRLPEGSTTLPEGFSFKFLKVSVLEQVF